MDTNAGDGARSGEPHVLPSFTCVCGAVDAVPMGSCNAAHRVLFLVSGAAKREALARVFDGPRDPLQIPPQRVDPVDGQVMWMIDREAAVQSLLD